MANSKDSKMVCQHNSKKATGKKESTSKIPEPIPQPSSSRLPEQLNWPEFRKAAIATAASWKEADAKGQTPPAFKVCEPPRYLTERWERGDYPSGPIEPDISEQTFSGLAKFVYDIPLPFREYGSMSKKTMREALFQRDAQYASVTTSYEGLVNILADYHVRTSRLEATIKVLYEELTKTMEALAARAMQVEELKRQSVLRKELSKLKRDARKDREAAIQAMLEELD